MRIIDSATAILLASLFVLIPVIASAQITQPTTCDITDQRVGDIQVRVQGGALENCPVQDDVSIDDYGLCCVFQTVYTISNYLFITLIVIVVLLVVVGAFYITTAAGNPENVAKGRNFIIYAAIGLAIALLARGLPGLIRMMVGV